MYKNVAGYLDLLKKELHGCDSALIQDALADAEEHLRTSLENEAGENTELSETEVLQLIIKKYGEPAETAAAYRKIESFLSPSIPLRASAKSSSGPGRFIGIVTDTQAWGAALFMFLSVVTGTVFGGWALLAGILSGVSLVFVIGLPIIGFYLLSLRGIALMEGRFIEALLGVRMPHKPIFVQPGLSLTDKFKALITESYTWKLLLYYCFLFPLGIIYSLSICFLFLCALCFFLAPALELVFNLPLELMGNEAFTPTWLLPLVSLVGLILLPLILHFARFIGRLHGRFAKSMLVRK